MPKISRLKVTIYFKGPMGFGKVECYLVGFGKGTVEYVPKRGRKPRTIMSYYSPFWLVVEGWGYPDPGDIGFVSKITERGAEIRRGKYRSTDPQWVEDFMSEIGNKLRSKTIAVYRSGSTKMLKPEKIPKTSRELELRSRIRSIEARLLGQ